MLELLHKSVVIPHAVHVWMKDALKIKMLSVNPFARKIWKTRESHLEIFILV